MFQLLHEFFYINRQLALPGIGVFTMRRQPAMLDYGKKAFVAPVYTIGFSPEVGEADEMLVSFISKQQRVGKADAVQQLRGFTTSLSASLQENSQVRLPGIGSLSRSKKGIMQFEPVEQLPSFFPDASVENNGPKHVSEVAAAIPVFAEEEQGGEVAIEEQEIVATRSNWWIFAIILSVVAITAIIYYYLRNGSLQ